LPLFIGEPPVNWQNLIQNDFEKPVFEKYPEIEKLKDTLYLSGALYASMSGSGSSVYGIFEKDAVPVLDFPEHYFFKWV
jgi:4-diphosphocytidyl-2-C-methyl-D-erythritol kinase